MGPKELGIILPKVVNTAIKAGTYIRGERKNFKFEQAERKKMNDLVSYVDKNAEKMIVDDLRVMLPGSGFIVEEDTASGKSDYNWIVDPLDGTTNFIHGIPCYGVSIGLENQGEPILGVVYEVGKDECFYAYKGSGAFMNGEAIKVSARAKLSDSLIGTGFPVHNFSRMEDYLKVLQHLMKSTHGVRRIGAAAPDLCYIACGRLDAFFEYGLQPWDVCAGALIVKEAGGSVADFGGGDKWLFSREMVATNGFVKEEFGELMKVFSAH
jgi:myo-inositol-1(or 4)-monophosphatase